MSVPSSLAKRDWSQRGKSFIVGRRSWITSHLRDELERRKESPQYMEKYDVGIERLDGATLYLIAGVARPTEEDMEREVDLCQRATRTGARLVYLSSCAVDRWEADSRVLSKEGELYILGKRRCEQLVTGGPSGCGYALRAPVIFGAGQPLESDQLLPTIVSRTRDRMPIVLQEPFRPFELAHVSDVVKAMVDIGLQGDSYPVYSLWSQPTIDPVALCALAAPGHPVLLKAGWQPFDALRDMRRDIYHVARINCVFRRDDVVKTVEWYDEEDVPQLIPAGTKLLEG